jgi:Polyprenyl synthetase
LSPTYTEWALRVFREAVAPVLAGVADDRDSSMWVSSCGPGESAATRFRLFPGSLYFLWLEALGGEVTAADRSLAAALECLHNASLHHDDALDDHDSRRGVATARARGGSNASILVGDGLIGLAMSLLASAAEPEVLARIAAAWTRMTLGQSMDEPEVWCRIAPSERRVHWELMSRAKLALGNVAAPLAAIRRRLPATATELEELHTDFSIVSQIMNDIGDLEGWAGFHVTGPCDREVRSESSKKPTIGTIWSGSAATIRRRAEEEIERRTAVALRRLASLPVDARVKPVLVDFFETPRAAFREIAAELRDARG